MINLNKICKYMSMSPLKVLTLEKTCTKLTFDLIYLLTLNMPFTVNDDEAIEHIRS